MSIFTSIVNNVDTALKKWRWNNVVPPMYGIYMVLQGVFFLIRSDEFLKVAAYEQFFHIVPIWMWALLNIGIGIAVIIRDNATTVMIQSVVMIFEGTSIVIASIGNTRISPTAGLRGLILGIAFCILSVKMLTGDTKSYKNKG